MLQSKRLKILIAVVPNCKTGTAVVKKWITNPQPFASGLQIPKSPGALTCHFDVRREEKPPKPKGCIQEISPPLSRIRNDKLILRTGVFLMTLLFLLTCSTISHAQTKTKKVRFSGFLEYLNNTWIPDGEITQALGINEWQMQGSVYNRLNLWYTPTKNLEFYAGMRNNFTFGPMVATYSKLFNMAGLDYADLVTNDNGYLDLTFKIASNKSYIFYTNFDRASVKWTKDKFELTVGRQRINWGANLIWNPNDIFNAYNFFDFNYVERPGSDAVLMEYYTGDFSSVQLAGKLSYIRVAVDSNAINRVLKPTVAAMYRFNQWDYDFQVFGGVMETDITAGLGWAGSIAGAGFTGEASWFRDMDNFTDTTDVFVVSISANYTFRNSIFINFSGIYNSVGATGPANAVFTNIFESFSYLTSSNLNAKKLVRSRLNIFGQISYPVSPLINLDVSSIYNPYDGSGFVGPTVIFSLSDNISLMLVGQMFWGKTLTEYGDNGQMLFLDLKWSF